MVKKVTVSLPLNAGAEEMYLFEPFLTYELPPQKVKIFRNVFVGHSGYALNNNGLIKETHHDHPWHLANFLNEASHYYYDVEDHPENLITLDDDNTYLLIHHPWHTNYYHWILECLFRLWMVRAKKNEVILLLPELYKNSDFIVRTLEPLGFEKIFLIPPGKSLMVRKLCIPQIKAKVDSYDYKMIHDVRNFYIDYVTNVKNIDINLGERIYISRKKAQRKRVENEADIEGLLLKYDFHIINNEDYNFFEQVAIYSQAKYLVSMHGSGLTNMIFMQKGSKIFEFHKRRTNNLDWHSKAFWYLAEAMGFEYYQQLCDPTDINDDYFNANFIVDAGTLEKNLALMFPS